MNADDIRAYKKRWEMVAAVEQEELGGVAEALSVITRRANDRGT